MITKETFERPFQGASSSYSNYCHIGVTTDKVIEVLNKYTDEPYVDEILGGSEEIINGVNVVCFTIFRSSPDFVYDLTYELDCRGYADTAWDSYFFVCAENGKDCDTFTAYWDPFEVREDTCFDAFVTVIDTLRV